jgi:hypothetical protein
MKKISFFTILLATLLVSCDDYLDINDDPNRLLFEKLDPSKLLPGAQASTYRVQATTMNTLGNVYMNSWTRNVQGFGNGYDKELQLVLDNGFYNGIYDGLMQNLKNFDAIEKYPNTDGTYDNYQAVAKICKAHYMQYVVDLYGNVPFKQAWNNELYPTPSFDDDFEIYKSLIQNIKDAKDLILNAPTNAQSINDFDIMLGGDMDKWTRFANTLQLRMVLRMSNSTNTAVQTYVNQQIVDLASIGDNYIENDVEIDPGYGLTNDDQMNPAVLSYYFNAQPAAVQNRTFITMTGHAYKSLQNFATTNYPAAGSQTIDASSTLPTLMYPNVTDPRSGALFTTAASGQPRRAVNQGSNAVDVTTPAGLLPGQPCRLGIRAHFNPYNLHAGDLPGYASVHGFVMTLTEALLLKSEAALRFPSLSSLGGQLSFEAAIDNDFLRKTAGSATSYKLLINAKPNFGWTGTTNEKLHAIMYQKWIALMGIHGIESFIEYNRTGFPITPLSSVKTQNRKPYRLIYSVNSYIANSANTPAMSSNDPFAINQFTPFWVAGAN